MPPIKTKINISKGPALPTTAAKAIVIAIANLKAPAAVAPNVLIVEAPPYDTYMRKSAPYYSYVDTVPPVASCSVVWMSALVQNALSKK